MKNFLRMPGRVLGLAVALTFALFASQGRAQDQQNSDPAIPPSGDNTDVSQNANAPQNGGGNVSFQTFYDQLASQGTWIKTDKYGYVFQPTESDSNWRPYAYGHWVNTDQGMTWVSDEPFGWATYHYGRWANLDGAGWVWVPGYTWAPAWVSWRDSDEDVGWAPLPPDSDEGIDYYGDDFDWDDGFLGFHIGDDCDLAYGIGPWWYNFCPIGYIGDRDCWRHFRDHRDNFGLIGRTRNVTNINFRRDGEGRFGRVTANGPSVAALNARARTPIQQARLTAASDPAAAGLRGNTLAAYAPGVDPATMSTARPGSVSRTLAGTAVNRGTDINRPLTVNSHIAPAGATAAQIHAATAAQANMPANARVAGLNTQPSHALNQPLTSLRTDTRTTPAFRAGSRTANTSTSAGTSRVSPGSVGPASSVSRQSAFTGAPATSHAAASPSTQSAFTGAPVTQHASSISSSAESRYTGEAVAPHAATVPSHTTPSYSSGQSYYHSAPVYHSGAPSYYHSQPSFRSYAPATQSHFGGGSFGGSAPAAHYSGGSFGGGARSFSSGGGGGHSFGGGGRH